VDDAAALKLAAAGWTACALALSWGLLERRRRQHAESARRDRERESDADRVQRMARQRDAVQAMRDALAIIDQAQSDDEDASR
jgi:hypothetical protein